MRLTPRPVGVCDASSLAVALLAHLTAAALAMALPAAPRAPTSVAPTPATFALSVSPPPMREEEAPVVGGPLSTSASPAPLSRTAARPALSRPRGSVLGDGGAMMAVAGEATSPSEVGPSAVVSAEMPVPPPFDPARLDPRAVARAAVIGLATGPESPPQEGRTVVVAPLSAREASSLLDGELDRAAHAKAYVTRRGPIHLTPRPDGSYHYDGSAFDADIRPDGRVVFRDRDDATIDPIPRLAQTGPLTDVTGAQLDPPLFHDAPIAGISIGGTFDGDSALSRARGEDPHRAERARFLEETESLRERLEDEARARRLRRHRARDAGPGE